MSPVSLSSRDDSNQNVTSTEDAISESQEPSSLQALSEVEIECPG